MEIEADSISEPGEDDGKDLPVVHFKGISRSLHSHYDANANSNIKGTVRTTKEGEVRWMSVSVYQGEERWRSEGIQVGGIRSSRGVLGHWFDKDYDPRGPAGPTAFRKISNEIEDGPKDDADDTDDEEDNDGGEGEEEDESDHEEINFERWNKELMSTILGMIGYTVMESERTVCLE
jgi:hypothetical protein